MNHRPKEFRSYPERLGEKPRHPEEWAEIITERVRKAVSAGPPVTADLRVQKVIQEALEAAWKGGVRTGQAIKESAMRSYIEGLVARITGISIPYGPCPYCDRGRAGGKPCKMCDGTGTNHTKAM